MAGRHRTSGGIDGGELVNAVDARVHGRLAYTSSGPTDDAVDTLLLGAGVCRDYAHLILSLLRARDVRPKCPVGTPQRSEAEIQQVE